MPSSSECIGPTIAMQKYRELPTGEEGERTAMHTYIRYLNFPNGYFAWTAGR